MVIKRYTCIYIYLISFGMSSLSNQTTNCCLQNIKKHINKLSTSFTARLMSKYVSFFYFLSQHRYFIGLLGERPLLEIWGSRVSYHTFGPEFKHKIFKSRYSKSFQRKQIIISNLLCNPEYS